MRRRATLGLTILFLTGLSLSGCSKEAAPPQADAPADGSLVAVEAPAVGPADAPVAGLTPVERYDLALLDALNLVAERKLGGALEKMLEAKAAQDTEQIRQEIDKLKQRIDQQAAAESTTQAVQTVLNDGKPEDAARLAASGLRQFGDGDAAPQLISLTRQADALATAQGGDVATRRTSYRADGDAALRDKNLRAAAIAYEQALQLGEDADLRRQVDELRGTLARYDDGLRRAAELRRDPANLEQAVETLKEAARAWDTLQVRQEIDDYTLALQLRRDRLSVADFEVRGDVGIPAAGKAVAEELLPAFKARYDLAERGQLNKVIDELRLEASDLADNAGGREQIGKLARVRYLVLGSLTPLGGITVQARLVDLRTGLVVQTAKLVAPTPEEMIARLPELAKCLQMTDQQKIAYEQDLARQGAGDLRPVAVGPIPAPPVVVVNQPPPPLIVFNPRPPDLGGLNIADFDRLQPPPAGPIAPPVVVVAQEGPVRERTLALSIELGDNLFRRGRYREAHVQFDLALNLFPGHREVQARVDLCRPFLPPSPPPDVVVVVNPPRPPLPRVAVVDFVVSGDPAFVSPGLGAWTADNLAPYFCPPYQIVDRGTVSWYMARLGMTMRDLVFDPNARRWLGRALGVRHFVFGTIRQGIDGLDVATHLIDAEFGYEYGTGRVLAANPLDLRLRLPELAQMTLLPPEQRVVFVRERDDCRKLVVDAQVQIGRGEFTLAFEFLGRARKARPNSVEVEVLVQQCERQRQMAAFEAGRRAQFARDQERLAQAQQQQLALAREAERLRIVAAQQAAALDAAARQQQQAAAREAAYQQLLAQALAAQRQNNITVTVQIYQSACALKPNDEGFRLLAQAKAQAEEAARVQAAQQQAQQEAALRRQRETELAQVRTQLDAERQQRAAQDALRVAAQQTRDAAAYKQSVETARNLVTKQQFDQAIAALQTAQQVKQTDEVKQLLADAANQKALVEASKKDAAERARLEQQLADEKARRVKAEADAQRNQELYTQALQQGQQALTQKQYGVAAAKFQEAGKVFKTDVVLTGLRAAQDAQAQAQAQAAAAQKQQDEERARAASVKQALDQGQAALDAKQYDKAVGAFTQAKTIAPNNVDVLASLAKAQQAQADAAFQAKQAAAAATAAANNAKQQDQVKQFVAGTQSSIKSGQLAAAEKILGDARRIAPLDPSVVQAGQDLDAARVAAASTNAAASAAAVKKAEYDRAMVTARDAMKAQNYVQAVTALTQAGRLQPGDKAASDLLSLAQAKAAEAATAAANAAAHAATNAAALKQKQADFAKAIGTARDALAAKRYDDAAQALASAQKLQPGDPTAADLLKQVDQARADARAALDAEAKKKQDASRVTQLVAGAQASIRAGQFDAAAKALADARQLAPLDPAIGQAAKDLEAARAAGAAEAARKQKQAEYSKAIQAGREALAARRYDDAMKDFSDAGKLMPGDATAADLLRQATKAKADAGAAATAAATAAADAARVKAALARLMDQGQAQMTARRFADAVATYTEAVKLAPTDPAVAAALQKAKQALDASKPPPVPALSLEYTRQMQAGAALEKQQKWADASKAYRAALAALPGDGKATGAVKNADFNQHLAEGQKLFAVKRYADAAKEFEEAVKLQPDSVDAKNWLKRAKDGKP